jgi:DNA-binding MarR family transcriptional regulator
MKDSLFSDEEHNIWLILGHIRQALTKARERELLAYDITPEQADTLFCVQVLSDEATLNTLSRCMLREHHTVSALINRMEAKGLVSKVVPASKRKVSTRVRLTKKGKSAYRLTADRQTIHRAMSVLSSEEKMQLRRILEKLRDAALRELAVIHRPLGPPPLEPGSSAGNSR